MFIIHEPFALLKPTNFNHAHNEYLEVVLAGGLPGVLLLAAAIGWWGWASIRAWRLPKGAGVELARLGSAMLFLILVASVFDYPARTPLIMGLAGIAATWLARAGQKAPGGAALPSSGQSL